MIVIHLHIVIFNPFSFDNLRTQNCTCYCTLLSLSQVVISFRGTEPTKAKDIFSDANIFQVSGVVGAGCCVEDVLPFVLYYAV